MMKKQKTTKPHSMHQGHETVSKVLTKGDAVAGYELSSGKQVNLKEAAKMAHDGCISGVTVSTASNGKEYLRSSPDGSAKNNLSNLPYEQM